MFGRHLQWPESIFFSVHRQNCSLSGFWRTPGKLEPHGSPEPLMFPYIFLISLSALAMGILNSFHRFGAPAFRRFC